jgi:hypothetical protein
MTAVKTHLSPRTKGQKAATRTRATGRSTNLEVQQQIKAIRRLTVDQVAEIASSLVMGGLSELKAIATDPEATVLQIWFSRVAGKGISAGDMRALDAVLDRIIGKPKTQVVLSGDAEAPVQVSAYDNWSADKLILEVERLRLERLATGD